jgi:hypothetical protein
MGLGPRLNNKKTKAGPVPPLKIENRTGIQAPSEVIWEILVDINHWGDWNPLYKQAEGEVRIGGKVAAVLALPEQEERIIRPVIVEWVPYEQIIWADKAWRGWVQSTRYFEIEQLGKSACFFSNGELFDSTVARWYGDKYRRAMKKGFAAMSEALKVKAEAVWQSQQGETK